MDAHVLITFENFKADNITLLLLVEVLGEDISALSMSLTPLFRLSVEELQTEDTFTELVHDRSPKHHVNLVSFPTKEGIDIWELA